MCGAVFTLYIGYRTAASVLHDSSLPIYTYTYIYHDIGLPYVDLHDTEPDSKAIRFLSIFLFVFS